MLKIIIGVLVLLLAIGGLFFYLQKISFAKNQLPSPKITQTKNTLYIGENIDEDGLDADTQEFQPFIDYLVSQLKPQGITEGKFIGTKSVAEMAQFVRDGKIDIIIDSAFPVYAVNKLTGAQLIANRWKGGLEKYHSIYFVKATSPIKTLDDLNGKIIGFDGQTATTGYFLPKAELIREGYTLTFKNSPTDKVLPNEIGYTFVGSKVYEDVADGTTAVGSESEGEVRNYFGDKFSDYRIIGQTPDILRFLVAARVDLDPTLSDSIKNILLSMDSSVEGKKVLNVFAKTAKFTPVTNSDAAYGEIRNLSTLVQKEIVNQ